MTDKVELLLEVLVKITSLSVMPELETRKAKLLKGEKAIAAYSACDGFSSIPEIVKMSGYSTTSVENNLPIWEREGLVISIGFSNNKRYLAMENLGAYLAKLRAS